MLGHAAYRLRFLARDRDYEYRREEAARRLLEFWRAVLPELARP